MLGTLIFWMVEHGIEGLVFWMVEHGILRTLMFWMVKY